MAENDYLAPEINKCCHFFQNDINSINAFQAFTQG